jgi:hypothetical protein
MTTTQNTPKTLQDVGFHYDTFVGNCGGWARRGTVGGVAVDDVIFRDGGAPWWWESAIGYLWCRVRLDDGAEIGGRWFPTRNAAVRFALMVLDSPTVTEGR